MSDDAPTTAAFLTSDAGPVDMARMGQLLDTLALSMTATRLAKSGNHVQIGYEMWGLFKRNSMVQRVISQYHEQAFADGTVRPKTRNATVQRELDRHWREGHWSRKNRRAYPQFLLSGEHWVYCPRHRDRTVGSRLLTPWFISDITGIEPEDWEKASYSPGYGSSPDDAPVALTNANTAYYPHNALFDTLRGLTPFSSLYFAIDRYQRWLDARERITRVAANIVGHLSFATMADAGNALGWSKDSTGNFIPKPVYLPTDGTVAVTIGEGADFKVLTPDVNGGDAEADGRAFYNQANEGSRLPEYWSGDGRQVNVATAKVQYPVGIRSILSVRDAFTEATVLHLRLVMMRLRDMKVLPGSWLVVDENGDEVEETVEDALIGLSWPEVRELDFDNEFAALQWLFEKRLIDEDVVLEQLGYDPRTDKPRGDPPPPVDDDTTTPEARARAKERSDVRATLLRAVADRFGVRDVD